MEYLSIKGADGVKKVISALTFGSEPVILVTTDSHQALYEEDKRYFMVYVLEDSLLHDIEYMNSLIKEGKEYSIVVKEEIENE